MRMRYYTVLLKPGEPPETARFVRDGFHLWAFVFTVLWALWRGLWLAALLEAGAWQRAALERRGWVEAAVVAAPNRDSAEQRFATLAPALGL
jgi:hypothetical protein